MRILITAVYIIINFLIQSTILHYIEIRGVIPNTTIILVVSYALLRGSTEGAIVGFFTGLLQDIFFGTSIGYFALFTTVTGYLFGRGNHNFYRENYILPMMLCAVAVLLYETMIYITSFLFRGQLNIIYILVNTILPETVYSCIFTIPLYRILFGTNEWLELKEKYKYRLF